jgi:hypothetical protein
MWKHSGTVYLIPHLLEAIRRLVENAITPSNGVSETAAGFSAIKC